METEQQSALLQLTDSATQAQGFHFSKAESAGEASELLGRGCIETVAVEPLETSS